MRKTSMAVVTGLIAAVLSVAIPASAGAAVGSTVETGLAFVQGAEADGQLVFAWTETFEGSVTTCSDLECAEATSAIISGFERLSGYALVGGGAVVAGVNRNGDPVLADCLRPSCSITSQMRPAPQTGRLFVAPDGSLVIVDGNSITTCTDTSCASFTTDPAPDFRDVDMDPRNGDLVFLTEDDLLRCGSTSCENPQVSSHELQAVTSIGIDLDGLPLIALRSDVDDDAFVPRLARCGDIDCTLVTTSTLTGVVSGRTNLSVVAGTVDWTVAWISIASEGKILTSPADCEKTANGTAVELRFDGTVGRSAQLRVNNKWTSNLTDMTSATLDPGQLDDEIVVRHWFDSESVDVVCEAREVTPPPPPVAECTLTRSAGDVTVNFASNGQSANLRRDGRWLASVRDRTSYVDQDAPNDSTYELVRRVDGQRTVYSCLEVDGTTCSVTAQDGGVELSWANTDGNNVVLRKNGRWLTSPTRGQLAYVDAGGSVDDSYLMRLWSDPNTFVDVLCS